MPKPRVRSSIGTSSNIPSSANPPPLSRISIVSSPSENEQQTEKPLEREPRPCSTALLSASPAASWIS